MPTSAYYTDIGIRLAIVAISRAASCPSRTMTHVGAVAAARKWPSTINHQFTLLYNILWCMFQANRKGRMSRVMHPRFAQVDARQQDHPWFVP